MSQPASNQPISVYQGLEVCCGPRACRLPDGRLLVSFMRQTKMGSNDFRPTFCIGSPDGETWEPPFEPFASLTDEYSIFAHVGPGSSPGELLFYGSRCARRQGEMFWDDTARSMLPNDLVWARSTDGGRTWSDLHVIPHGLPAAAEVTSPICVTRTGRWVACFCPHRSDSALAPEWLDRIIQVASDDGGKTWKTSILMQLPPEISGAEAWLTEVTDGRLLATAWQIDRRPDAKGRPNLYVLSGDGGESWTPATETPIYGQSTGLLPLADGSALFTYNQRAAKPYGIGVARVRPTRDDFGVLANRIVWEAGTHSRTADASGEFSDWLSFSFGEPSLLKESPGCFILFFWRSQDETGRIDCVRFGTWDLGAGQ